MANLDYKAMGEEMTTALGMEHEDVIKYWSALERGIYFLCVFIYEIFRQNRLTN